MEKAAEKKDWMEMMKIMQDIRQFCSLHVKRSPKGGIAFIGKSSDPAFSM